MRWDCVEKRRMESYNAKGGKNIQYFVWLETKDGEKNLYFFNDQRGRKNSWKKKSMDRNKL